MTDCMIVATIVAFISTTIGIFVGMIIGYFTLKPDKQDKGFG